MTTGQVPAGHAKADDIQSDHTQAGDAPQPPHLSRAPQAPRHGAAGDRLLRRLCGTVLIMEAVVIALAIVPAHALEHVRGGVAGGVGGSLAILGLLLGGMVGRPGKGWALAVGSVFQVLVIVSGIAVPAMYFLGAVFAALWITGIWLARHLQRQHPAPA